MPPPIVAPKDVRYPGTIRLNVDASDIERRILSVRETMPVRPGEPIVLFFPQWLPGNHSPTGRVDKLAGLTIRANGTHLEWRRDVVDVFAFHVDVPPAVTSLDIEFQFTSPVETSEGRVVMTPEMLNLQWNTVLLVSGGLLHAPDHRRAERAPSGRLAVWDGAGDGVDDVRPDDVQGRASRNARRLADVCRPVLQALRVGFRMLRLRCG